MSTKTILREWTSLLNGWTLFSRHRQARCCRRARDRRKRAVVRKGFVCGAAEATSTRRIAEQRGECADGGVKSSGLRACPSPVERLIFSGNVEAMCWSGVGPGDFVRRIVPTKVCNVCGETATRDTTVEAALGVRESVSTLESLQTIAVAAGRRARLPTLQGPASTLSAPSTSVPRALLTRTGESKTAVSFAVQGLKPKGHCTAAMRRLRRCQAGSICWGGGER